MIPRSCSISMKSDAVARCSAFCLTAPACCRAPPYSSSFSVMVVFPESGWEIMARFLLRSISAWGAQKSAAPPLPVFSAVDPRRVLVASARGRARGRGWKAVVPGPSHAAAAESRAIAWQAMVDFVCVTATGSEEKKNPVRRYPDRLNL